MDITSLLFNRPSLIDYLGQGNNQQNSYFNNRGAQNSQLLSQANQLQGQNGDPFYIVDLSADAQDALDNQNSGSGEENAYIQKAQKHFLSFFKDNGIDLKNMSTEATELIAGIIEVIGESETTAQDVTTDQLEYKLSKGGREVYTLTGENRRIRVAIEEQADGSNLLTITDFHDNTADIAEIKIQNDEDNTYILVERSEENFINGRRVSRQEQDPINIRVS